MKGSDSTAWFHVALEKMKFWRGSDAGATGWKSTELTPSIPTPPTAVRACRFQSGQARAIDGSNSTSLNCAELLGCAFRGLAFGSEVQGTGFRVWCLGSHCGRKAFQCSWA